jgi:glycosyltransferase involved in cell wall biosynthesis
MSKKRIAINLLSFETASLTGVGYFFKRLLESLPPLPNTELFIFCQQRFNLKQIIRIPETLNVTCINVPNFSSRIARIAYEQFVLPYKCRRMDILYSPCVANPLIKINAQIITTIHDLTPFFVAQKYNHIQRWYVRFITKCLASRSDKIITVSKSSKEDLINVLGVQPSRIDIVYNFIHVTEQHAIRYEPFFLSVGTLQPGKNLSAVIRSFAIFCNRYDTEQHRLIIIGGNGWGNTEYYTDLISKLKMNNRIEFLGYVDESRLNQLYATCKGNILLSLYEGFGIPVLEALSWHKPSIASRNSSLPEVMGTTGIAVDPNNHEEVALAIKAIAADPQKYLIGRDDQLKQFSSERQVAAFIRALGLNSSLSKDSVECPSA